MRYHVDTWLEDSEYDLEERFQNDTLPSDGAVLFENEKNFEEWGIAPNWYDVGRCCGMTWFVEQHKRNEDSM